MTRTNIAHAPTRAMSPQTSYEAAETVDVSRMQELTLAALNSLKAAEKEPSEAWRIQQVIEKAIQKSVASSTVRTRLSELTEKGFVIIADRDGKSLSGHRCARYALAEIEVAA